MKYLLSITLFTALIYSCKKNGTCYDIQGTYRMMEITVLDSNGVAKTHPVPDTGQDKNLVEFATVASIIIIDKDHGYIQYQGAKDEVKKTTGSFTCDNIAIADKGDSYTTTGGPPTYKYSIVR